ncbi:MAG TPA: glycosyltransferase [Egibacteraceae bacterium]|nr:glycosyltransferase [Egibacteraceae bacterium]
MSQPDQRVAVVIATRNRVAELSRTLERLAALPERPRVVVVDNASTDGTPRAVARRHPDAEVVTMGRNLGAAARNVGARRVRSPYVAFADDDSWWAPGSLSRAADLLDRHERLALVAPRILVGPAQRLDPTCTSMAASPLPTEADLPGPPVLGFLACAAVVRRAAFLAVGGFEPRLLIGGEEELVAWDLAAAGWGLSYIDAVVAHHHPSPARDVAARRRLLARNRLWVGWLRRPAASAARRTAQVAQAALWDPPVRSGLLEALAGVGWVLARRQVVPPAVERRLRLLGT